MNAVLKAMLNFLWRKSKWRVMCEDFADEVINTSFLWRIGKIRSEDIIIFLCIPGRDRERLFALSASLKISTEKTGKTTTSN